MADTQVERLFYTLDVESAKFDTGIAKARATIAELTKSGTTSIKVTADAKPAVAALEQTKKTVKEVAKTAEDMAEDFGDAGDIVEGVARKIGLSLSTPLAAAGTLTVALVGIASAAVSAAASVDVELRALSATLPSVSADLGDLRQQVAALSAIGPRSQKEIAGIALALAQVGDTDPREIARNLQVITLAADALGKTDARPLVSTLDILADSFGLTAEGAREAFVQIVAFSKGRLEIEELTGTLDKSSAKLNALGITAVDAAKTLASLLDGGVNKRTAQTGLTKILDDAGDAADRAQDKLAAFKEGDAQALTILARTITEANIAADGLTPTLALLYERLDGSKEKFRQAGLGLSEYTVAQKAAAIAAEETKEPVDGVAKAYDDLRASADRVNTGTLNLNARLKNELSATLTDLGNKLLPTVNGALEILLRLLGNSGQAARDLAIQGANIVKNLSAGAQSNVGAAAIGRNIQSSPQLLESVSSRDLRNFQTILGTAQLRGQGTDAIDAALKLVEAQLKKVGGAAEDTATATDKVDKGFKNTGAAANAAAEKFDALRDRADQLAESFQKVSAEETASRGIDAWAKAAEKAKLPADEIARRVDALTAALERSRFARQESELRAFTDTLLENGVALQARLKAERDAQSVRELGQRTIEDEIASLEKEAKLLGYSAKAAAEYVQQKARQNAIDKAGRDAAKEDGASDTSIAFAKNLAARLFDARTEAEKIRDALSASGDGGLAGQLGAVASQFTQIATSLGDSGQNLARIAGVLGPLFSGINGLSGALRRVAVDQDGNAKKDAAGNIVTEAGGFLDTLRGKNGATSQAKAIASSVAIIGAVAGIADALDLFGTRAKAEALQIKEAARQFAVALQDFTASANPQTGASEAIRQAQKQAQELARQAAAAGGGTATFEGAGITSDELRKRAEGLRLTADAAAKVGGSGRDLADRLRTIATGFDDVAKSLVEVEVAARAQVLANTQDLAVRALIAAGRTEEAEVERERLARTRELAAAQRDTTAEGKAYADALALILSAESSLAEATRARAKLDTEYANASRELADRAKLFNLQGLEYVSALVDISAARFAELGGILNGLDVSTAEGLATLKERAKAIFETLAVDGITDAEQRIIDALFAILDAAETAAAGIDEAAKQLAGAAKKIDDAFAGVDDANSILGGDARTRFRRTADAAVTSEQSADLESILSNLDIETLEGAKAGQQKLRDLYANLAKDGVTASEQLIVDLIKQLLGDLDAVVEQAGSEIDETLANAAANRAKRQSDAANAIALGDLEGADAFAQVLSGLGPAFERLFGVFDVSTLDGVTGAKAQLSALLTEINGLSDEQIVARFGQTRDEVVNGILQLDTSMDGLASGLRSAAQATDDFTAAVSQDYLRSQGRNQEADIAAAKSETDARLAQARALGLSQTILDQITAIGAANIAAITQRYADAARSALAQSTPESTTSGSGPSGSGATTSSTNSATVSGASIASAEQALRITDYLALSLTEHRSTAKATLQIAAMMAAILGGPVPSLRVPVIPPGGSGVAGGAPSVYAPINIVINLPPGAIASTPQTARELAEQLLPHLNRGLARAAGIEARVAGAPLA